MEKKTKKMAELENQIAMHNTKITDFNRIDAELKKFEPTTEEGKKAHTEARTQVANEVTDHCSEIRDLHQQLEVATVEFITGRDTDVEEPTPADALRNAS